MSLPVPVDQAQAALQANANAATTVTNYAQAAVTAVPEVPNPPDWFVPIQNDLNVAQTHANNWLNTICPAVTTGAPQGVVDFNTTFQSISQQILSVQQDIENSGGTPTADQRQNVGSLFGSLTGAMSGQEKAAASLQGQIKEYFTDVESDQDNLGNDLATVAKRFTSGQTWIQQLTAVIGENFLSTNVLGPCTTIVEIDINITLQIGGVNADPTLITLILAKAIIENQKSNQAASEQAIQEILDTWTTLVAKTGAVISDLNDAEGSQYINILSECDLQTAQTQWQQLADFASGLTTGSGGGSTNTDS